MKTAARRLRTPQSQLVAACAGMLAGGWLIAEWVFGLVLIVLSALFLVVALLRQVTPDDEDLSSHQSILRRFQQSP